MRDTNRTNHHEPLLETSALSRVSFQHGLRSGGGPEFGHDLVSKEIAWLCKRGDVSFGLSLKQNRDYLEARRFLEQRYKELGLPFDPGGTPFVYSSPRDGSGICMTLSRSPGVLYQPGAQREPWESASLWVHELTHATASVAWGAERDATKPSGWKFTISRAGCMLKPKANGALGLIFEEYAACANQSLYMASLGELQEARPEKICNLPIGRHSEADVRLFKILKRLSDPGMYAETESSGRARAWERALVRDKTRLGVPIEAISWTDSAGKERASLYHLVSLLDGLAIEVYPDLSPAAAAERFRELAVKAQVTGKMPQLLVPIREALGHDALKFLLEWGQSLERIASGEESALLALFVQAGALGKEEAREVRRELHEALRDKRKGERGREPCENVEVERLIVAAQERRWSSWLESRSAALIRREPDLHACAAQELRAAMKAGDLGQAATIFLAAGFSDEQRPTASHEQLEEQARRLLAQGQVRSYQGLVDVFQPERELVAPGEIRVLLHNAAIQALREDFIGIFCDVVTSPLCNRDELLTPRVRRLVDAQLQREIPFILKLRLERALVGESLPD